eukprot:1091351-Prorocentrum_lima.AAC.1
MITGVKRGDAECPEGSYCVGQGAYTLEVLEGFSSSMNYKGITTPGGGTNPSPNIRRNILKK